MPITFNQIATDEASVTLKYGTDSITIVYYPNKLTGKMRAEIEAGTTADYDVLSQLIKSWDVYEDDAQTIMFPIERMSEFGIKFTTQVVQAIAQDYSPNSVAPQNLS